MAVDDAAPVAPLAEGALAGVRILDLTSGIAGPLGVLLLAEQGAQVLKVEPPGGDPMRSMPGSAVWHRSRRSVTLDLDDEEGRAEFDDLLSCGRRARRELRARDDGQMGSRLRGHLCEVPASRLRLGAGLPGGEPQRRTPRLRRARPGARQGSSTSSPAGATVPYSCTSRRRAWPHASCWPSV